MINVHNKKIVAFREKIRNLKYEISCLESSLEHEISQRDRWRKIFQEKRIDGRRKVQIVKLPDGKKHYE